MDCHGLCRDPVGVQNRGHGVGILVCEGRHPQERLEWLERWLVGGLGENGLHVCCVYINLITGWTFTVKLG